MSLPHFTVALPQRPRVRGAGGASCLGKNVRGLEWPGLGSGLAIVPQEKVIRKWNLDQLTAVFVQGRVGWEKCFWKLFFFFPSLHFPCWDKCKPCLQKHAAGDHISSSTKKCRGAERRGVKRYLLKQRESRGTRLVWQEHQTKYTVYSICLPEMSLPIWAEAQVSAKAFFFFLMLQILVIILIIPTSLSREVTVFVVHIWVRVITLQLEPKLLAKASVSSGIFSTFSFAMRRAANTGGPARRPHPQLGMWQ